MTGSSEAHAADLLLPNIDDYIGRVMQIAPALIYVYNQATQSNEYSNRNVGDVLGYSAQQIRDMGAQLMNDLLHPDDRSRVFAHFERVRTLQDDEVATIEYRVKHSDGHWIWLLSRDQVFQRDVTGAVTHHIGAAIDISQQKQSEAEARQAEHRAIAVNDELREFSYAMSHDIKAPTSTLQLILSELELAVREGHREDQVELFCMANTTLCRMRTLIDEVLRYTNVIEQDTSIETVDLGTLLQEVKISLRADIAAVKADLDIGPLPHVRGEAMQLSLLFQNLIQNGLKFSSQAENARVEIFATKCANTARTRIHVRDNGIGVPAEQQEYIFQLFNKLNKPSDYEGSGIGLAICRRVATNHNTEIQVASEPGEGATFSIELDLA